MLWRFVRFCIWRILILIASDEPVSHVIVPIHLETAKLLPRNRCSLLVYKLSGTFFCAGWWERWTTISVVEEGHYHLAIYAFQWLGGIQMNCLHSTLRSCIIISHPLSTTIEHGGCSEKRCRQPECQSGICLPVKITDRRVGNGRKTHTKWSCNIPSMP